MEALNPNSLDTLCAALCYAMDVEPPEHAAPANEALCRFVDEAFGGQKCDRLFMFNPDAVAQWLFEKYDYLFQEVTRCNPLHLPLRSPNPSVTPVCFATMYTGAQPEVHGIQAYEKPVVAIDTIFDAFVRAGKRCALIADHLTCSMAKIFLNRDIDYFIFENAEDVNAQAMRLIQEDRHDFIICYNENFDQQMHRRGPESILALSEIRCNSRAFGQLYSQICTCWKEHRTLMGFAMDHGCHHCDYISQKSGKHLLGNHGQEIPEDLNILHFYTAIKGDNT